MDKSIRRGSWEMVGAMLISGTIGWFVLVSGVPVIEVVFWRCVIGALTLAGVLAPGVSAQCLVELFDTRLGHVERRGHRG